MLYHMLQFTLLQHYFYKYDQFWQFLLILIIAGALCYIVNLIMPGLVQAYDNTNKKMFSLGNNQSIETFKIPSTVIYRVRKNYDVSLEDIQKVESELKNIFNNAYKDITKGDSPNNICNKAQPITYVFWNELYKTGDLYNNFCTKALGKSFLPPFQKIKEMESSLELNPTH